MSSSAGPTLHGHCHVEHLGTKGLKGKGTTEIHRLAHNPAQPADTASRLRRR